MGREVRCVPANWEHPKDGRGEYIPLFDGNFDQEITEWETENAQWQKGLRRDWISKEWVPIEQEYAHYSFEEWNGKRPNPADYMPARHKSERTHYMMYETTTEGTPISPAFATPEELAHWLADTGASAFGDATADYEA